MAHCPIIQVLWVYVCSDVITMNVVEVSVIVIEGFFFLLRLGVPQAILLIMAYRAVDFKVSCSQIPRRAFAGILTHYPLVVSPTS
jgi:hypothetical protein